MQDFEKTKEQLIDELAGLRSRVALLEMGQTGDKKSREAQWASDDALRDTEE